MNPDVLNTVEETKEPQASDSKGELDPAILEQMMMTGDNTRGMFTPNEEEVLDENIPEDKLHEETDEEAKVKAGKVTKKFGAYQKKFLADMKKNPDAYMIDTPKGKMNVAEAIKQGYDPATKDFTEEPLESKRDKKLEGLSDSDKEIIKKLTDPSAAHIPSKEAEQYGLSPDDPRVAQMMQQEAPAPEGQAPEGEMDPAMLQAMLGGGM